MIGASALLVGFTRDGDIAYGEAIALVVVLGAYLTRPGPGLAVRILRNGDWRGVATDDEVGIPGA